MSHTVRLRTAFGKIQGRILETLGHIEGAELVQFVSEEGFKLVDKLVGDIR